MSNVFNSLVFLESISTQTELSNLALRSTIRRMTKYQVDIVSDTVCPWCYVGKNRLDKAIKIHKSSNPDDTFETTWYPFYLNPDAPPSIDKEEYYHKKFGPQRTQ